MKLMNRTVTFETLVQVGILDELRWLHWAKSKDGAKNRNVPKRMLEELLGQQETDESPAPTAFATAEEFEKRRAEILKGVRND